MKMRERGDKRVVKTKEREGMTEKRMTGEREIKSEERERKGKTRKRG